MHLQLRCQFKRLFDVRLLRRRKSSEGAYELYAGPDILKRPLLIRVKCAARSLHGIMQLATAFQVLC